MYNLKINKKIAKPILFLSKFFNDNYFILVCKGYNEDYDNFTGLYWSDDKDLVFSDDSYSDFQLWLRFFKLEKSL